VFSCRIEGCKDERRKAFGLCTFHYDRKRRFGDPTMGGPRQRTPGTMLAVCSIDGCGKQTRALDLCSMHYSRLRLHGSVDGGYWHQDGRSKEWRTGKDGYVSRWAPMSIHASSGGLVYQHREIVGEMLGRRLLPTESVHHKNGNRADNRLENLELWVKAQPAGQRVDDLLAFARDILDRYESIATRLEQPVASNVLRFK